MSERAKILIVDDEPFNVDYLEQELEDFGYDTISATNGQEALDKVAAENPDLILLDVMMPLMDGFTVCRILKEHEDTRLIPVVMMTALGSMEDRIRGIEAGANALIERYFSTFLDCIHAAGGDINETAGDGFMAIFQDAQHASSAADTALALLAATQVLNTENAVQPLTVHMGLNSGIALVGSTRFEGVRGARWTFTASGAVTNLASRLAGLAKPGEILIGPETAHRLGGHYRLQRLGPEHLKNIDTLVEVYCLSGHSATGEPRDPGR